uniref:hypothetical protein n=1 Tax=Aeromonas sp. Ne-1 TaxID=1675689 RepID=UPI0015631C51|nr:hypothetical protein [Aeromonas sp. Ne-1]
MMVLEKESTYNTINLEKAITNKQDEINSFSKEIERAEAELKRLKDSHATAMQDLCKLDIYNQSARRYNQNNFFTWIDEERELNDSKGKFNNLIWDYDTPTMKFKIKLKIRKDLKVWKYEVHVSGYAVYYESFECLPMYERERRNGWCWSHKNFLIDVFEGEALSHKFKTYVEAVEKVNEWKNKIESSLAERINKDKDLYSQAIERYKKAIRIELLTQRSAATFHKEIKNFPLLIDKENYWKVTVSGENAKEIVHYLKAEFQIEFQILAG